MSLAEAGAIESGSELEADLCIIGGGAAGIALARAFIGARQRVLLLEGGGLSFDSGAQRLYVGDSVGAPGPATAHSRFRLLGGSTARWAGQCRPLDAIDFEARDWVPFSGWPFPRAELAPWYRQAAAVCNLAPGSFAPAAWPDCAAAMPLGGGDLETVLYRFAHPADFGQAYRAELAAARNVEVLLEANAVALEPAADLRAVRAIAVRTLSGRAFTVRARAMVLACGGIENARLLLASNQVAAAGSATSTIWSAASSWTTRTSSAAISLPADPAHGRGPARHQELQAGGLASSLPTSASRSPSRCCGRERLNGAAAYFIRRFLAETAPEYFSPGGQSLDRLRRFLAEPRLPDQQPARHLLGALRGCREAGITLARLAADLVRPRRCLALRIVLEPTPCPDSRVTLAESVMRWACRGSGSTGAWRRATAARSTACARPCGGRWRSARWARWSSCRPTRRPAGRPRWAAGATTSARRACTPIPGRAWSTRTAGSTASPTSTSPAARCSRPRATPTRR